MSILEAIILGVVQGLTEFLPVSSSGHLVLFQKLFGISSDVLSFDIAVHFATLIAVFIVLWKDIVAILKKPFGKLSIMILVATIPAVVIGLPLKDFFEKLYKSGVTLGIEFIITGLVLLWAESQNESIETKEVIKSKSSMLKSTKWAKKLSNKGVDDMNAIDALVIGVAQAGAILPAVSRSGLTLAGALARGLNREFAIRFSFLMSIPVILGPAILDLIDMAENKSNTGTALFTATTVAAMIAACVAGIFAMKFMIKLFSKYSLKYFAYYVFIIAALILFDQMLFGIFFKI